MELFCLTLPNKKEKLESWANDLQGLLIECINRDLHINTKTSLKTDLISLEINAARQIKCRGKLPDFKLQEHGDIVYKGAADAIAQFIVKELEYMMLSSIIQHKYSHYTRADKETIFKYSSSMLAGQDWDGLGAKFHEADQARRTKKVADEAELYLQLETELNFTGFITFRLEAYRKELSEIVEYALDEFMLDKQYQEFISLLKYFVYLQDTKVDHVHLLHKGGQEFQLYDGTFRLIEPEHATDRIVAEMIEAEMNIDDRVISSLISVSPKHITVHTKHPQQQVIRTIESIFDQRVTICQNCISCSSRVDEMTQS